MVRKLGTATSYRFQSILIRFFIIKIPTTTRVGATATEETKEINGLKNKKGRNKSPVTMAVHPVFPPSCIPVALSRYTVALDVPNNPDAVVAIQSTNKALFKFSGRPVFLSKLRYYRTSP